MTQDMGGDPFALERGTGSARRDQVLGQQVLHAVTGQNAPAGVGKEPVAGLSAPLLQPPAQYHDGVLAQWDTARLASFTSAADVGTGT